MLIVNAVCGNLSYSGWMLFDSNDRRTGRGVPDGKQAFVTCVVQFLPGINLDAINSPATPEALNTEAFYRQSSRQVSAVCRNEV